MRKIVWLGLFLSLLSWGDEKRMLFYGNCIACHGELGRRVAPSLHEVKGYYLLKYPQKEDFVKEMVHWLLSPNAERALDQPALKKYNLMPYLAIDAQTLREIATYIYESDDFGVADGLDR